MKKHFQNPLNLRIVLILFFVLCVVSGSAILLQSIRLSDKIKISVELLEGPPEDITPPEVIASFIPLDVEEDEGIFEISFDAKDDIDPEPNITAVVQIFLPEDLTGWENPDLDEDDEFKIEIDYKEKEIEIKGSDPEKIWNEIQEMKGLEVENNTAVEIELKKKKVEICLINYNDASGKVELKNIDDPQEWIENLLFVTAEDDAGNIGIAYATPSFNQEETTTTEHADPPSSSESSWNIPDDVSLPSDWSIPSDIDDISPGWDFIPSIITLSICYYFFRVMRRRKKK